MGKRIDNTDCHCLKMRRSAENIVGFYDRMLAPAGVTLRQYSLLSAIAEQDGCSIRELGDATLLERSTLARSLKPLEKEGLVEDRRAKGSRNSELYLTAKGQHICRDAAWRWKNAQHAFEEKIGAEKVTELESILNEMQNL